MRLKTVRYSQSETIRGKKVSLSIEAELQTGDVADKCVDVLRHWTELQLEKVRNGKANAAND